VVGVELLMLLKRVIVAESHCTHRFWGRFRIGVRTFHIQTRLSMLAFGHYTLMHGTSTYMILCEVLFWVAKCTVFELGVHTICIDVLGSQI
jgi:hypothetical protein